MSELEPSRFNVQRVHANYVAGATNVEHRFALYDLAQKVVNFDDKIASSLGLTGNETIADVGTSNGEFLFNLRANPYRHQGELYGIDPHPAQFPHEFKADDANIHFLRGYADSLPLDANSVDIVTEKFMFYHIAPDKHQAAIDEVKRVLAPGGRFVLATSGDFNKVRHREFEARIAHSLQVQKPPYMNDGYDTESAMADLPSQFRYVLHYQQHSLMVIDKEYKLQVYMASMRSLRDQYDPPLTAATADRLAVEAAEQQVEGMIRNEIRERGRYLDYVMRDFFICSDEKLVIPNPEEFADISNPNSHEYLLHH